MFICIFKVVRLSNFLRLLFLTLLAVSGTILIRHISQPCTLKDLGDVDNVRKLFCRHGLYDLLNLKPPNQGELNCSKIIKGDSEAINQGLLINADTKGKRLNLKEQDYINMTRDCQYFKDFRKYITIPVSKEEEEFPIAYSMVVHDKIEMFERLLRVIYAPQNIYCVHVDGKAPVQFKAAVRAITSCFNNVFVASKLVKVVYASWSRVQADFNCMKDLLQSNIPWKYLLNTCGTDFPLKTNAEIVRVLKTLNGKNTMESEKPSDSKKRRWEYHHEVRDGIFQTDTKKLPPPISSPMFSGNAYFVVSRDFVQYIFVDKRVQKLIDWVKDTYSPDEHLWATLNRMPGVPGSSPYNDKYELSDMNSLARMVKWQYSEGDIHKGGAYPPCTGIHRRAVCVYGTGDLSWILKQHHLFANKFDPQVDNVAIDCMEEYIRHKTIFNIDL
ncbi:beta-1,3-galactosyl-O-glycosyl-glycoprotein beta-1,6-N-acetylglucosaminyltransferase 3-like [Hyla sarda]|uniref:beta-1,3-galactosyl-O-glycosyl-glycoprotein beta-1,6-N-acetylglucosaminyltransferase 3-like n=1 Tax=Hyla sarda TaxID=327740 RepID=UPI0024C45975|nr:beta-1,3-galactosyl-O-glycosyl-glycoprotein beta-1,6-N-acetylglucosaminyltransferase 3-like [Hyla sarda]